MNNDSAPGLNEISINMVKYLKDFISILLKKLFNQILRRDYSRFLQSCFSIDLI